jgi:hypothetical protein
LIRFKFIDSLLCHLYFIIQPIEWIFYLSHCIFYWWNFYLVLFKNSFHFFAENFHLFIHFKIILLFFTDCFKASCASSGIWTILGLASVNGLFLWQ